MNLCMVALHTTKGYTHFCDQMWPACLQLNQPYLARTSSPLNIPATRAAHFINQRAFALPLATPHTAGTAYLLKLAKTKAQEQADSLPGIKMVVKNMHPTEKDEAVVAALQRGLPDELGTALVELGAGSLLVRGKDRRTQKHTHGYFKLNVSLEAAQKLEQRCIPGPPGRSKLRVEVSKAERQQHQQQGGAGVSARQLEAAGDQCYVPCRGWSAA